MKDYLFQPGGTKPEGSGMKAGQITKKTRARREEHEKMMSHLRSLCRQHHGKSVDEILDALEYNPLIHAILLVTAENTPDATRQKYSESILARTIPTLAKEEVTVDGVQRIEIVGVAPPSVKVTPTIEHHPAEVCQVETPVDQPTVEAYNADKSS